MDGCCVEGIEVAGARGEIAGRLRGAPSSELGQAVGDDPEVRHMSGAEDLGGGLIGKSARAQMIQDMSTFNFRQSTC